MYLSGESIELGGFFPGQNLPEYTAMLIGIGSLTLVTLLITAVSSNAKTQTVALALWAASTTILSGVLL